MKENTSKKVRLSYGWIFAAFTVVVGALFIWKTLSIYLPADSENPYTRELVLKELSEIRLFFWLWVALAVAGFVLWEVFPVKRPKAKISADLQLSRIIKKVPAEAPAGARAEFADLTYERRLVFALRVGSCSLLIAACIYGIVYLCTPEHFTYMATPEIANGEVWTLVKCVFPLIFAALAVMCGAGVFEKITVKRMLPNAKKVVAEAKREGMQPAPANIFQRIDRVFDDWRVVLGIRSSLAVAALVLIIVGIVNGNMVSIFNKAVAICTQCIGLG